MDDATRHRYYVESTYALGMLATDPVGLLTERGIKGQRSNRDDCIVRMLNAEVPPPEGYRWLSNKDHVRLQLTADLESVLIVFTPDPLRDFGEKFDKGRYPELLDEELA
ncbi:hypothetical protein HOU95_gp085 [Streptomyces phage Hiyaa]|uniref:Uncharacterized protein n=1 Tax=Streptomyces phage Hiyaa TaxID=2499072 RepID=A0A3S9U8S3_9CAUD|nr:hypothetical protein HOU95_gp085 [Streptomyces phage Hiyaa]AZS06722.1 hypothetical protein SEA_HIYAA_83 [Streptomyces phage Hiyaa]